MKKEIRAEAIVRNIGSFARFLECASLELGVPVNIEKISQDVVVNRNVIVEYYQILLYCLIADIIEPITTSRSRQRLNKSQ